MNARRNPCAESGHPAFDYEDCDCGCGLELCDRCAHMHRLQVAPEAKPAPSAREQRLERALEDIRFRILIGDKDPSMKDGGPLKRCLAIATAALGKKEGE